MQATSVVTSKSSLSEPKTRLIELMQRLNFGRIENLVVANGEPVFEPLPRVFPEPKFGAEKGPRPEAAKADFALKSQVCELFAQLEALDNVLILRLEVQHGLPFRMVYEEVLA